MRSPWDLSIMKLRPYSLEILKRLSYHIHLAYIIIKKIIRCEESNPGHFNHGSSAIFARPGRSSRVSQFETFRVKSSLSQVLVLDSNSNSKYCYNSSLNLNSKFEKNSFLSFFKFKFEFWPRDQKVEKNSKKQLFMNFFKLSELFSGRTF